MDVSYGKKLLRQGGGGGHVVRLVKVSIGCGGRGLCLHEERRTRVNGLSLSLSTSCTPSTLCEKCMFSEILWKYLLEGISIKFVRYSHVFFSLTNRICDTQG